MKIREILGINLEKETFDMLDLFLIERFNQLTQEQAERADRRGDRERSTRLETLVMEHYSEDKEKCKKFLDWMTDAEGEEKEELYLHGIRDGIRAARLFASI